MTLVLFGAVPHGGVFSCWCLRCATHLAVKLSRHCPLFGLFLLSAGGARRAILGLKGALCFHSTSVAVLPRLASCRVQSRRHLCRLVLFQVRLFFCLAFLQVGLRPAFASVWCTAPSQKSKQSQHLPAKFTPARGRCTLACAGVPSQHARVAPPGPFARKTSVP
ncbi:hypothetical protein TRVL_09004 [Trypanosoma vivax]|nr:hypothetical protein TRVL_09004 [Trypanosoma vivax]